MNGKDQITLNQLYKLVTDSNKVNDNRWKKIEPVVKAYHDKKIINEFLRGAWRGAVAFLVFLSLLGGLWTIFKR